VATLGPQSADLGLEKQPPSLLTSHSSTPSLALFLIFFLVFMRQGLTIVAQADLKLAVFLPLPPKCWDYRHVLPCPAPGLIFLNYISNDSICALVLACLSSKVSTFFFLWWYWSLKSGLHTCKTGALSLEQCLQSSFGILKVVILFAMLTACLQHVTGLGLCLNE
jgi:hypothetical protein